MNKLNAATLCFVISVSYGVALACECTELPPVTDALVQAAIVFVGKPIDITETTISSRLFAVIRFNIDKIVKGKKDKSISILTPNGGKDCGFRFKINETYLVYASESEGGFYTTICDRTRLFDVVGKEELKKLEAK